MPENDPFANVWDRLVDGAVQAALKARERPEAASALDKLTTLLGTTPEQLAADPSHGREAVGAALGRLAEVVRDAASAQPERRQAASDAVKALAAKLEHAGIKAGGGDELIHQARQRLADLSEDASRRVQALLKPDATAASEEAAADEAAASDATAASDEAAASDVTAASDEANGS
jgi:hypothetical protein